MAVRLLAVASVLAVCLLILAGYLHGELKAVRAELVQAKAQVEVSEASADISDKRAVNVGRAIKRSEESRRAVQKAPDIDSALAEFGAGLDGVRAEGHRPVTSPDGH